MLQKSQHFLTTLFEFFLTIRLFIPGQIVLKKKYYF